MKTMNNKGFTLIEVLIALSIAVVAAGYTAQIIASTNKVTLAGKQKFVATNLAQEGLELTRKERDNTWLAQDSNLEWANNICDGDPGEGINRSIALGEEEKTYKRNVIVNCEQQDEETEFVEVESTVSWAGHGGEEKSVMLKESLYNWYE